MPGMLTGAAAVITAVSGLLLALSQAGWLGGRDARSAESAQTVAETPSSGAGQPEASKASASNDGPRLTPALQQVKIGNGVFTLVDVATEQRTADQLGLRIHVRLQNNSAYPVNFWNDLFRLIVDDVPRAPVGDLNKVLAGNAAEEGDVDFTFPANATSLVLKIRYYGEETD
ncbi:MAG TPA: hypothetical protein VGC44_00940, partial [Longimicrobiales bacterium]